MSALTTDGGGLFQSLMTMTEKVLRQMRVMALGLPLMSSVITHHCSVEDVRIEVEFALEQLVDCDHVPPPASVVQGRSF